MGWWLLRTTRIRHLFHSPETQLPIITLTDPALGLNGGAFHTFVATKTDSGVSDTLTFNTPFRMMLDPGATFFFSPADNVAVSGYLVKQ